MGAEATILKFPNRKALTTIRPIIVVPLPEHPHILLVNLYSVQELVKKVREGHPFIDQFMKPWIPPYSFFAHCNDGFIVIYWLRGRYEWSNMVGQRGD